MRLIFLPSRLYFLLAHNTAGNQASGFEMIKTPPRVISINDDDSQLDDDRWEEIDAADLEWEEVLF